MDFWIDISWKHVQTCVYLAHKNDYENILSFDLVILVSKLSLVPPGNPH